MCLILELNSGDDPLDFNRWICLIHSNHIVVVRQTWVYQKQFLRLSKQYVKTELNYDVNLFK